VILEELAAEVAGLKADHGVVPGLAVVIVGDRSDSKAYVRMKKLAAKKIGFHSVDVALPATATQAEILAAVEALNADPKVTAPLGGRRGHLGYVFFVSKKPPQWTSPQSSMAVAVS
jgi:5,10-methylene-tetrahydrofolate dehydrogenase/methenyl tetrahydrofolate cyclohydrolase